VASCCTYAVPRGQERTVPYGLRPFHRLSTHLAEIASNNTYTSAAVAAGQFLSTVMLDAKTGLVIDSGTLGNGTVACNVNPPYSPLRPYATGHYIEALAVLADVDAAAAAQWTELCAARFPHPHNTDQPRAQIAECGRGSHAERRLV
jgi:hypothetical protein